MQQYPVSRSPRSRAVPRIGPGPALRTGPVRRSVRRIWPRAVAAFALAAATWASTPSSAASKDGTFGDTPDGGKVEVVRPARWWLEIYAHTMQEQAFIRWMDVTTGGHAWRHTMQEKRVNAIWEWWIRVMWELEYSRSDSRP